MFGCAVERATDAVAMEAPTAAACELDISMGDGGAPPRGPAVSCEQAPMQIAKTQRAELRNNIWVACQHGRVESTEQAADVNLAVWADCYSSRAVMYWRAEQTH